MLCYPVAHGGSVTQTVAQAHYVFCDGLHDPDLPRYAKSKILMEPHDLCGPDPLLTSFRTSLSRNSSIVVNTQCINDWYDECVDIPSDVDFLRRLDRQ